MIYVKEVLFFCLQVFNAHSSLLDKGFALSHPPTIMQALEGNLPFCWQSNERAFLKDFVACTPGTSGGRLARYVVNYFIFQSKFYFSIFYGFYNINL